MGEEARSCFLKLYVSLQTYETAKKFLLKQNEILLLVENKEHSQLYWLSLFSKRLNIAEIK